MYLKAFLLLFLSFKIYANSQIDDINNFLDAKRFSYEQVTENSTEIISGKLILDTLQIYLEIVSPYRESYLVSKNFITYTREDGVANPEIRNLYIDDYDKVWIGTYGSGVGFFDGETWGSIDKRDGLVDNTISALTSFGNNVYWFGSGDGFGLSEYRPTSSPGFARIKEIVTSNDRYLIKNNYSIYKE